MNKYYAMALAAALSLGSAYAQHEGPLVDALVKKGVLTSQEGEDIRAELTSEFATLPAGKLDLGSDRSITKLKIYGDVRLRYQWENAQDGRTYNGAASDNNEDRSRYRYRLRVGADYTFIENWNAGVRFETSENNDSTNNDFGGYFDKTGDQIFVGLAYLQYTADDLFNSGWIDMVDLRMGKHKHPFLLSKAWWDGDTNPEGISEQIGWKNVAWDGFDVTLRGGQYITQEVNNQTGSDDDAFLFMFQLENKYSWAKKEYIAIAPTLMVESSGGNNTVAGNQEGAAANTGENSLQTNGNFLVIALPVEAKWTSWDHKMKAFGTVGANLESDAFYRDAYGVVGATPAAAGATVGGDESSQNIFWNVGYQFGEAKKKGEWQVGVEYRYIETAAYTPNLSDSDFGKNENNQHGVVLGAKYAFTDFITGAVTWMHSNPIDGSLRNGTGNAAGGARTGGIADNDTVDLVQVDLNWMF